MKISYLVTCSSETGTLDRLLYKILNYIKDDDEVLVIKDVNDCKQTDEIVKKYLNCPGFPSCTKYIIHPLNNNYGAHKNFGIETCTGDYIFQIDADELPPEILLGDNIHEVLEANPTIEAYAIPRINDFRGVTDAHAKQWGWKLSISPTFIRPIVNWPDYQFRIFKKDYPRISFLRRLHEKIEGYNSYVTLPAEEDYALYHDKTIEKQVETNLRYNKLFTEKENQGHNVFGNK
jgi:glycosyltransferase involved in cell wall biosynthesis